MPRNFQTDNTYTESLMLKCMVYYWIDVYVDQWSNYHIMGNNFSRWIAIRIIILCEHYAFIRLGVFIYTMAAKMQRSTYTVPFTKLNTLTILILMISLQRLLTAWTSAASGLAIVTNATVFDDAVPPLWMNWFSSTLVKETVHCRR